MCSPYGARSAHRETGMVAHMRNTDIISHFFSFVNRFFAIFQKKCEFLLFFSRTNLSEVPGVAAHLVEGLFCLPAEFLFCEGGVGICSRSVAGTSGADGIAKINTIHALECIKYLKN